MWNLSVKKIVLISSIVSFLCTSIFVANFVHPVFLPLSTYLKNYEGFWIALQGIGIPLSLFFAIYLPTIQRQKEDLERLVAHRNIAFFVERYARVHISASIRAGKGVKQHDIGYMACVKELEGLDRSQIRPAYLIEKLVDIICFGKRLGAVVAKDGYDLESLAECTLSCDRMTIDIEDIDKHLRAMGVRFDGDRIAHV